MNLIQRFRAKTPPYNKRVGRMLTVVTGMISTIETTLYAYQEKFPIPTWLHVVFVCSALTSALWAAYHGAQVKK